MEKKKNTGLFVVIGILILLMLVLVILLGVLVWKGIERKGDQGSNRQENTQVTGDTDVALEDLHFVQNGYRFSVPGKYELTYADKAGVVVLEENVFQMKLGVVDSAYEEVMNSPEEFTKVTVDAGGTIVQDMKETDIDGKKYAYYRATLQNEELLVIYTAAPDEGGRIAGQIALLGENVPDEDMLQMFASVASNAEATDQGDSTKDDIVVEMAEKKPSAIEMEWIGESAMEFGGVKTTHKIPENFYLEDSYEGSEYAAERYTMTDPYISVTCALYDIPWYANVESYIHESKHLDDTKIKTMKIEGHKVYYIEESFMNDEDEYQQIYAGIDLGEHQFYVVEAYVIGEDMELTTDVIREFLILE